MTPPVPSDDPPRCYVYYRVDAGALGALLPQVRAMQHSLQAQHPGLRCGLLRRPELREGQVTVMETYAGAVTHPAMAASFAKTLAQAAAALPQPRHTEWFEPL